MSLLLALCVLGLAVVLTPLVTRVLGRQAGWPLAALYLISAGVLAPVALEVFQGGHPEWAIPWVPQLGIDLALRADGLSIVFGYIALLIGAVVFIYSTRYLERGRQLSFYLVMTTFTFSMLLLVTAADLVVLFIAWELTSLSSFLLIARSGHSAEGASMRTLLLTFIGGLFLMAAVVLIWARVGTTSLSSIWGDAAWQDPAFTTTVALLVALAAFSKSAQFPFHVWLPDAMAAITPVSAYLHAAAVVKAGIFLLLRFSPVFQNNLAWNVTLLFVGLFTSCIGAWFALQQTDFKRLMAYSTVSQLGLIVATIGIGTSVALAAAVFHTIAHALFKSGLFMLVGVVDHATGTRDLRRMPAKLYRDMPVTFVVTLLGCASMAGVPPMLGFASKEAIFTALTGAPGASWTGWAALAVAAFGAVLTFSYCTKIVLGVFVDGPIDDRPLHKRDWFLLGSAATPILASVALVPFLWVLDPVVGAGADTAAGTPGRVHLSLWHGFTPELAVTLVVLTLGALVAWKRHWVFAVAEDNPFPVTGADVIAKIALGLRRAGTLLSTLVSGEAATRHVLPILGSLVAIAGGGVLTLYATDSLPAAVAELSQPIDLVILILISVAVFSVCRSRSRLAATVSLSAVGILATVQILSLGAPDVALTQLLVETLTIIVIMLVLQKLPLEFARPGRRRKRGAFTVSVLVGAAFAGLAWALNGRRGRSEVAQYYIDNTEQISGGHNVVNVILVEFRALDTLGELSVLGMAGVAILAVLSTIRDAYLDPPSRRFTRPELPLNPDPSSKAWRAINVAWPNVTSLQLMLRFINPILAVISVVLFLRGHNEPGGGFIAALVAAALIGLTYLSTSIDRGLGPPRLPLFLIGGGVVLAVVTGLVGLVGASSFLEPIHGSVFGIHLTTSMLFDLGVYLAVVGLMIVAFNLLGTSGDAFTREATRERTDEAFEGELSGPLDTVRGERRVAPSTTFLSDGEQPAEVGR